jgi:hypothetical protein
MTIDANPTLIDDLTPHYAGWYADDDRGPASTAARCAWPATPAASTSPQRGTPGLPPLRPCGYSPRWPPSPCTGTPLAWRTGSAPA